MMSPYESYERLFDVPFARWDRAGGGGARLAAMALPPEEQRSETAVHVFRVTTAALHDPGGSTVRLAEMVQDITAEKQAEAAVLRAGKLATVGELAGRVAHRKRTGSESNGASIATTGRATAWLPWQVKHSLRRRTSLRFDCGAGGFWHAPQLLGSITATISL